MAINQVNSYGAANTDIVNVQTTVDSQRIGYHQVSLTEWGTTTVPAIAAGSSFENNGALWEITTNTALTGSPSDGKVFIYFDSDAPQFVMTNTTPTWSDSKQGWYGTGATANYRYLLFVMTKSGSSYTDKRLVLNNNNEDKFTFENWTNNDSELFFASDASIMWDESEDKFVINKDIDVQTIYRNGPIEHHTYAQFSQLDDEDDVFDWFVTIGLVDGKSINISGGYGATAGSADNNPLLYASRSGTTVTIYDNNLNSFDFVDGNPTKLDDVFGYGGTTGILALTIRV